MPTPPHFNTSLPSYVWTAHQSAASAKGETLSEHYNKLILEGLDHLHGSHELDVKRRGVYLPPATMDKVKAKAEEMGVAHMHLVRVLLWQEIQKN